MIRNGIHRLTPTAGSLKNLAFPPSSSQLFSYCLHYILSAGKSQMIFLWRHYFFTIRQFCPPVNLTFWIICNNIFPERHTHIDKCRSMWLNGSNISKTKMENLILAKSWSREPAVGASRCGRMGCSASWVDPAKDYPVVGSGCPRYGLGLSRVREIPVWE